jgi:hypothetical protein
VEYVIDKFKRWKNKETQYEPQQKPLKRRQEQVEQRTARMRIKGEAGWC